jgi:hypothetical protein
MMLVGQKNHALTDFSVFETDPAGKTWFRIGDQPACAVLGQVGIIKVEQGHERFNR